MLSLQNPGLVEIEALTTMGVNVKDGPSIGLFGTGFKYAVSIILRLGGSITVYRGREPFHFTSVTKSIRGKDFEIVHMNGLALGFTTELGKTWEPWMAFRELYSNMLDEKGMHNSRVIAPLENHTTVHVDCAEILDAYAHRHEYFLERDPIFTSPELLEVCEGQSRYIFYRGIRAGTLPRPSLYTYNILSETDLSEDRTLSQYFIPERLANGLCRADDSKMLQDIFIAGEDYFEYSIGWNWAHTPSDAFLDAAENVYKYHAGRINKALFEFLCRKRPVVRDRNYRSPNEMQEKMLAKAYAFCDWYDEDAKQWPLLVADDLGAGVLGQAQHNRIVLAKKVFDMGSKYVASTIMEEHIHLKHHEYDGTREMQNRLMDMLASAYERWCGEPI